ncbi:MAG: winged helix-turn-helix domain-containing protein, partial [Duodenibacillus sp.]
DLLAKKRVSLILLDWMLPDLSGLQWLEQLKRDTRWSNLPVIMLTARTTESDKVAGLDAGADDYIVKPFSPRELMARVRAVLRRGASESEKTVHCGPLVMNLSRFNAQVDGVEVKLGVLEFRMLWVLASSPGRVYSRSQLLTRVWDDAVGFDERTVDVHILRLRKQLSGTAARDLVQTVRGVGYKMIVPPHSTH